MNCRITARALPAKKLGWGRRRRCRYRAAAFALLTLALSLAGTVWGAAPADVAHPGEEGDSDPLRRVIPALKLDHATLYTATSTLDSLCRLNLWVNWRVLGAHGITPDTPVTLDV